MRGRAGVAELVDALALRANGPLGRVGSSPSPGTAREQLGLREPRMAARQAHHAAQSVKTLREQVVIILRIKRNIAKIMY